WQGEDNRPMGTSSSGAGISSGTSSETWQCQICKVKINWYTTIDPYTRQTKEIGKDKVNNHQCLTCHKCNQYSSYDSLKLHETFECSANQLSQTQINQTNQVIIAIRQNLQTTIQTINNNPNLTQQQKNNLLNSLNPTA